MLCLGSRESKFPARRVFATAVSKYTLGQTGRGSFSSWSESKTRRRPFGGPDHRPAAIAAFGLPQSLQPKRPPSSQPIGPAAWPRYLCQSRTRLQSRVRRRGKKKKKVRRRKRVPVNFVTHGPPQHPFPPENLPGHLAAGSFLGPVPCAVAPEKDVSVRAEVRQARSGKTPPRPRQMRNAAGSWPVPLPPSHKPVRPGFLHFAAVAFATVLPEPHAILQAAARPPTIASLPRAVSTLASLHSQPPCLCYITTRHPWQSGIFPIASDTAPASLPALDHIRFPAISPVFSVCHSAPNSFQILPR